MPKSVLPLVLAGLSVAGKVFAGSAGTNPSDPVASTKDEFIDNVLCPIALYAFRLLVIISVLMIIYAAFLYVTAGSDEEKVSKAHKVIMYAAVGIVVALLAVGFPKIVASVFGKEGTVTGC
jgi:hypothetical protein